MSSTTVFVTGLPTSASQEDVADFFNRIGSVAEVQMPAADSTAPVAVVFDRSEDAAAALSISGSDFQEGVPIQIAASAAPATAPAMGEEEAGEEKAHDAAAPAGDSEANHGAEGAENAGRGVAPRKNRDSRSDITNKVIVSHLAPFTHRQDVLDAFAHCGELDDFAMVPPRHIAFLGFTTAEGFEKALAMNGATIKNARISVERRAPRPEGEGRPASASVPGSGPRTVPNRIVVRNVSSAVTEASVRAFFESDCGVPTDIYLKPQSGIVFVAFDSEEATAKAVAKSGQELDGVAVQVELREVLVCRRCGKDGHKKAECRQPYCTDCRVVGHANNECPRRRGSGRSRRGGGGGSGVSRRRRRSSSSSDRDRRRRRHRSDSEDRYRRRRDSRSRSRSRSPPRRRRDSRSRSRSPPRRRR